MKNITVRVPDDVYRDARIEAARRGRSVSALVTEFLRSLSDADAAFVRLQARQDEIIEQIAGFHAGDRLTREEVHVRAIR